MSYELKGLRPKGLVNAHQLKAQAKEIIVGFVGKLDEFIRTIYEHS